MTLRTVAVPLVGVVALVGWSLAQQPAATRPAPGAAPTAVSPDVAAINAAIAAYAAAFNKGDAAAVAGHWTEDAEYIADDGTVLKGRAAVADRFKALFADKQGLTMAVTPTAVKLLGSSAALVDGTAKIIDPKAGADASPFESAWVKGADGRWMLSRVRDLSILDDGDTNYEYLKELEWMVGEWTSESATVVVTMTCRWDKNQNFLVHDQTVKVGGKDAVTVTKYIGWDPAEGRMRSWVFDSAGGFGSGMWSRAGNEWTEEVEFRNRGAADGSARNLWRFGDDTHFEWRSVDRELDGQPVADAAVKFVRKVSK
jgi:uncharacterized protein (TIGR02246 family)